MSHHLTGLRSEQKNRAKELIEDFMIAANGVVATYLETRGLPSIRRVLRSPERWERIVELAHGLGGRLPSVPDAQALAAFLLRRRELEPEQFPDLSLSVIKLLGRGEYVLSVPGEPTLGHFGLAVLRYAHSTAPNRRFPDLLEQRVLKAAISGSSTPYSVDELRSLARRCTAQEENADKVELQIRKAAAAMLMAGRIGQRFDGIVTGASAKGTWVRILQPPVEGRVVTGSNGLAIGRHVRVELVHTDVDHGFIDFARVHAS